MFVLPASAFLDKSCCHPYCLHTSVLYLPEFHYCTSAEPAAAPQPWIFSCWRGWRAPVCKSSSSRAPLGRALLKLPYPPLQLFICFSPLLLQGISCVLPIRLISIVNNRCGAPGNPPPLLVDCKGFWLFVMRFNPYPPQGAKSLSKTKSHFILFHILRVLLPMS